MNRSAVLDPECSDRRELATKPLFDDLPVPDPLIA